VVILLDNHAGSRCIVPQHNCSRNLTTSAQVSLMVTNPWKTPWGDYDTAFGGSESKVTFEIGISFWLENVCMCPVHVCLMKNDANMQIKSGVARPGPTGLVPRVFSPVLHIHIHQNLMALPMYVGHNLQEWAWEIVCSLRIWSLL
jgi:hypothetical protein